MNIQTFINTYQLNISVETTHENPMGDSSWQTAFNHYALWLRSSSGQCALYVSTPGNCPPTETLLNLIGSVLNSARQTADFSAFCQKLGLPDNAGSRFYYAAVHRKLGDLIYVFGQALVDDWCTLSV